jgi:hypothetical protein
MKTSCYKKRWFNAQKKTEKKIEPKEKYVVACVAGAEMVVKLMCVSLYLEKERKKEREERRGEKERERERKRKRIGGNKSVAHKMGKTLLATSDIISHQQKEKNQLKSVA